MGRWVISFPFSSFSQHNDKPITSQGVFIIGDQVCHWYELAKCFIMPLYVKRFEVKADELIQLKERGRGAYGVVYEMRHQETGTIMAVKVLLILLSCGQNKRMCRNVHHLLVISNR